MALDGGEEAFGRPLVEEHDGGAQLQGGAGPDERTGVVERATHEVAVRLERHAEALRRARRVAAVHVVGIAHGEGLLHALGLPGGARRVHHLQAGAALGRLGGRAGHQELAERLAGDHGDRFAVGEHVVDLRARQVGVHRREVEARLERGELGGEERRLVAEDGGHDVAPLGAPGPEACGQRSRGRQQLAVRHLVAGAVDDGHRIGPRGRGSPEPPLHIGQNSSLN